MQRVAFGQARVRHTARQERQQLIVRLLIPPALITGFFWITSLNAVGVQQVIAAFLLLLVPWAAYLRWKATRTTQLPFFAVVALVYWLYFAVPLFWGDRIRPSFGHTTYLSDGAITQAMWMAVLGVLALWLGAEAGLGRRWKYSRVRDVPDDPRRWVYMRWLLVVGSVLTLYPASVYVFGEEGRQFVLAFESFVPMVIFVILFRSFLRGTATRFDKYTIVVYLLTQAILGIASGWLGALLTLALTCITAYLMERRRIPLWPIALAAVYVAFFQQGKDQYRQVYWTGAARSLQTNPVDQVGAWFAFSLQAWQQTLAQGDVGPQLLHKSVMRASLLTQTANVAEQTPSRVPYQGGSTYQSVAIGMVPRLFWPGKPSANASNQFYQVQYGVTPAADLGGVSIAVGVLTEAYINFGWIGIAVIMFLIGVLFDLTAATFLSSNSGTFYSAVGIAILMQFVIIESQMAIYVGGLLQRILVTFVLMIPATRWSGSGGTEARASQKHGGRLAAFQTLERHA